MMESYLDESGIHDGANACVISGYYGGAGQWKRFEAAWRKALHDSEVPLEKFHAKNLIKRVGFFLGWDDARYNRLIGDLELAVIGQKIYPFSVGIVVADFNSFTLEQRRFFTGARILDGKLVGTGAPSKPYFCPFQECLRIAAGGAPVGGKTHFFFGLDRPFAEYARVFMADIVSDPLAQYRERIGTPAFPLAKETPQLQAADFLAYRTYVDMQDGVVKNSWGEIPPPHLRSLLERRKSTEDFLYYNREALQATLNKTYELSGNWDGH